LQDWPERDSKNLKEKSRAAISKTNCDYPQKTYVFFIASRIGATKIPADFFYRDGRPESWLVEI